jgi:hypothetical protein
VSAFRTSPFVLAVAGLLSLASPARADYRHRVVLLEPAVESDLAAEVLARVRGELEAAGFELYIVPVEADADPKIAVESSARDLHPAAVLLVEQEVAEGSGTHTAELWVSDRSLQRTFVQRLRVEAGNASRGASWLAVQAVELVRARLAEQSVTGEIQPKASRREVHPVTPPPEPKRERHGRGTQLSVGFGLLHGFRGFETVWTPIARVGASIPEAAIGDPPLTIDLRLSASGMGGQPEIANAAGVVSAQQGYATVDAVIRFLPSLVVQPLLSVGNGFYTVAVDGRAVAPYEPHETRTWSGLTAVGAGLWLEPFPGASLSLEANLMAAWSKTVVRVNDNDVAEAGAPMGLLSLSLGAVF